MAPRRKSRNSKIDQLTRTASLVPRLRTRRVSGAAADGAARTPSVAGQEEGRAAGPRPSAGSSAPRGSWARCRQRDVLATASPVRSGRRGARASSPAGSTWPSTFVDQRQGPAQRSFAKKRVCALTPPSRTGPRPRPPRRAGLHGAGVSAPSRNYIRPRPYLHRASPRPPGQRAFSHARGCTSHRSPPGFCWSWRVGRR